MILLGHPLVKSEKIYYLHDINQTKILHDFPKNTILAFDFCDNLKNLIEQIKQKQIEFAVKISSLSEAIVANAIMAKYIICPEKIALEVQELAEYYLFDSKIAINITDESQIQKAIDHKVDCAILKDAYL